MTVVGVELGSDQVRAVVIGGWRGTVRGTFEAAWSPDHPTDVVARLRERIGPVDGIALSVQLAFLHPKHVRLPPAPVAERKRMVELEPDRFFPVQREAVVVSLAGDHDLAFAIDADLLERWVVAFEAWAPVRAIEPAPVAIARVLAKAGVHGAFTVPAGPDEAGVVEVDGGGLRSARRVPAGASVPPSRPLPSLADLPGEFFAARGAALGARAPLVGMLLSRERAAGVHRARVRSVTLAAALCVASLGMALWALDGSRERALSRLAAEVAAVTPRAQRSVDLRDRLAALAREATAIEEIDRRRADPLAVLASLSERLPAGATVLNARVTGDDWQIDGTAADAAALVPLLDGDERLEDVHFLSASSRFREGSRAYETFSIAFRARSEN